jgi:hypothetical protein
VTDRLRFVAGTADRFEVLSPEVPVIGEYAICHMRSVLHGRWADANDHVAIPLRSRRSFDAATTDSGAT